MKISYIKSFHLFTKTQMILIVVSYQKMILIETTVPVLSGCIDIDLEYRTYIKNLFIGGK